MLSLSCQSGDARSRRRQPLLRVVALVGTLSVATAAAGIPGPVAPAPNGPAPAAQLLLQERARQVAQQLAFLEAAANRGDRGAEAEPGAAALPIAGSVRLLPAIEQALAARDALHAEIREWEQEQSPNLSGGKPNGVLEQAAAFARERQFRRRLQDQQEQLAKHLAEWLAAARRDVSEERAWLEQLRQALAPPAPTGDARTAAAVVAGPLDAFEYYEVKEPAALQQLSALPEVYGDAAQWQNLLAANREKITDPAAPVPKGTLLLVPALKAHAAPK